jgi:hypothetical protein
LRKAKEMFFETIKNRVVFLGSWMFWKSLLPP